MSNPLIASELSRTSEPMPSLADLRAPSFAHEPASTRAAAESQTRYDFKRGISLIAEYDSAGAIESLSIAGEYNGSPRFIFSNNDRGATTTLLAADPSVSFADKERQLRETGRRLIDALPELVDDFRSMEMCGFWNVRAGDGYTSLPDGLRSARPVGVVPDFEELLTTPALSSRLFAVETPFGQASIFYKDDESVVVEVKDRDRQRARCYEVSFSDERQNSPARIATESLNALVDGDRHEFERRMGAFISDKSARQLGMPSHLVAAL